MTLLASHPININLRAIQSMWTLQTHPTIKIFLEAFKFKQRILHYSSLLFVLWVLIYLSVNAIFFRICSLTCEWLQKFPHWTHRLQFRLNRMASLLLTFKETGIYLPYSAVPAFNLLFNLFRTVQPGQHRQCVSRLQAGNLGFHSQQGQKTFLSSITPRVTLRYTQVPF